MSVIIFTITIGSDLVDRAEREVSTSAFTDSEDEFCLDRYIWHSSANVSIRAKFAPKEKFFTYIRRSFYQAKLSCRVCD